MSRRHVVRALVAGVLVAVAGYVLTSGGDDLPAATAPPAETRIDVDTPALAATKARAGIEDCPSASGASDLPAVTLACLGGGPALRLADVEGPAVVNLWASWCGPCKDELPLLARLDREAGERLTVIGVDYQDPFPDEALRLVADSEVTYPQLADPGGALADELRIRGMPGTLYVDAAGTATFVNLPFDSYAELTGLVRDHTGVDLPAG